MNLKNRWFFLQKKMVQRYVPFPFVPFCTFLGRKSMAGICCNASLLITKNFVRVS